MTAGYVALFASAFGAATIVPFSSEAVLAGMAASGRFPTWALLAVASLGNTLGALVNWALGRFCLHWQDRRWFPIKPADLQRASGWFNRWGLWSLLFSWVPVVGDPLTFLAGVMRTPLATFVVLVAIAKTGRYLVVLGLVNLALG